MPLRVGYVYAKTMSEEGGHNDKIKHARNAWNTDIMFVKSLCLLLSYLFAISQKLLPFLASGLDRKLSWDHNQQPCRLFQAQSASLLGLRPMQET